MALIFQQSQILIVFSAMVFHLSHGQAQNQTREGKLLSIFNVITFQNGPCQGDIRNGTCYTSSECVQKGGTSSGTCAAGYGVCCLFRMQCGTTSSENCTYFSQSSTASISATPCDYTICKSSSDVCRIKFDLNTFSINPPGEGAAGQEGSILNSGSIGQCLTDRFSITAPGNRGTPEICGFNSGQHVFLDASDECHVASFFLSGSGTRSWDVKVTQYKCDEERGGPDDCLQYFTGNTGTISSFNFPTTGSTVGSTTTHLANQCYDICIRRESGKCAVCYFPAITMLVGTVISQTAFGLSFSPNPAFAESSVGFACLMTDFIVIPGAEDVTSATRLTIGSIATGFTSKICGNIFSSNSGRRAEMAYDLVTAGMQISVCTQQTPFRITFKTDEFEFVDIGSVPSETANSPAGIVGFSLFYNQIEC